MHLYALGTHSLSKYLQMPVGVRHGAGSMVSASEALAGWKETGMQTNKLPRRGMGRGGITQVKLVLESLCLLNSTTGTSVGQPEESYFSPRYINRSLAGSVAWTHPPSTVSAISKFHQRSQHTVIYAFVGD